MTLKTPLHSWHVAHGGRMVDFAGWDMPVQYTTIVDEHQAVRTGAGLFDISHMGRLDLAGPDALAWIQSVFTNNAATMKVGQVRYGLVCNDAGGIRDDVLVYRWPDSWMIVVNASNRDKIVAWLGESKKSYAAELHDRTLETCMIAVQGPKAIELTRGLVDVDADTLGYYFAAPTRFRSTPCVLSRTGYTGEAGVELIVEASQGVALWDELIRRGAKPCGLGARDTLRLEAAMPLYGHELNEDIDPLQAGLGWAVKLDKGEFRGKQGLLTRDPARRVRVGLELAGKRIAREGAIVSEAGKPIGVVASGTFSPTLQKTIAMAYVDPAWQKLIGSAVEVDVRGKPESAVIVPMPFYKRGG